MKANKSVRAPWDAILSIPREFLRAPFAPPTDSQSRSSLTYAKASYILCCDFLPIWRKKALGLDTEAICRCLQKSREIELLNDCWMHILVVIVGHEAQPHFCAGSHGVV